MTAEFAADKRKRQGGGTAFTDIRASGWVASLPASIRPFALLGRFDRPIGAWLLFLPGLWSILLARQPVGRSLYLIILFAIGALVMRGAGCVVNDLWDRELDQAVTRTAGRPLASGAVSILGALGFLALLLAIGLAILVRLGRAAEILGAVSLVLVALYPGAKRVTWWPQAMLGLTFSWGAPLGYAAATGHLAWSVLPLYAAAFFWIVGYDTVYAHQDREDDALVGIRSTARLFQDRTRPFLALCYVIAFILLVIAFVMAGMSVIGIGALAFPGMLLGWQVATINVNDPARCLSLFKLNRDVGLLIALAALIGWL